VLATVFGRGLYSGGVFLRLTPGIVLLLVHSGKADRATAIVRAVYISNVRCGESGARLV
jgi:hypothetical protein